MKKEYIILAVLLVVLSGYLMTRNSESTHYELPVIGEIEEDAISRLDVSGSDASFSLVRDNDMWRLDPQKYPADDTKVEEMVRAIAELKLTALASESKNYTIYELEDDKRIEVAAYGGDGVLRKFSIGKAADSRRHTFVMLDGDHRVFHAQGNIRGKFTRQASELRDKQVLKIDEEITAVTLTGDTGEIALLRTSEPFQVGMTEEGEGEPEEATEVLEPRWSTDDGKPAVEREVEAIIRTLSNLRCNEFIEDREKAEFDSPSYTVTLRGVQTYTLSLFEKVDNRHEAISSACDYPFLIPESLAKRIMKERSKLLEEEA